MEKWTSFWTAFETPNKLNIGARAPIPDVPVWATPEVARGGFATGDLCAEQHVEWENALAATLGIEGPLLCLHLNCFFASPKGQQMLLEALRCRTFRAIIPEETALLSVALLVSLGKEAEAKEVVETIYPFFRQLRFFPQLNVFDNFLADDDSLVQMKTTAELVESLETRAAKRDPTIALAHHKAARRELKHAMVLLLKETVKDDWPLQVFPPDFGGRFKSLMEQWRALFAFRLKRRLDSADRLFALLSSSDFATLSGRDVGSIRVILKTSSAASPAKTVPGPVVDVADLATLLLQRLHHSNHLDICGPVTVEEANRLVLVPGKAIPESLQRKVLRSTPLSLDTLLQKSSSAQLKCCPNASALSSAMQSQIMCKTFASSTCFGCSIECFERADRCCC